MNSNAKSKPRRKYQTSYAGRYSEANLALPRDLQHEFRQVRHDTKLARMMDCRKVDKFDRGEHVFTPVAKPEHISFLNLESASLFVRTGAVLVSDCVSKERVITDANGNILGHIRNDVMLKLFREFNFESEHILGTNKTKYRFAV